MAKQYYNEFRQNQYEDEKCLKNGRFDSVAVNARYIAQEEPTYQNNELIEALPPVKNMEEVLDLIEKRPIYSRNEMEKDALYRLHAIFRLEDYLFPISKHFEIEQNIAIAIRRGYVNKKIFSHEHMVMLRKYSSFLNMPSKDFNQYKNSILMINSAPSASGFSIFGVSGGGKSTAVNNILSFYPQHIIHTTDGEKVFLFHQLTYIKIDCPYNGSIKGLCQKFFAAIDNVLGTDYLRKYGSTSQSIDRMIIAIADIALKHGLGILVIDEIQHLKTLKNNGSDPALNFFVTLMNEIHLPIVYIGTYKAIETLSSDFRQSRRANGIGVVEMNYLEREEFDIIIEDLWEYNWLKNSYELTDNLKSAMYDNTMGILDVIIKLFIAVQVEAIRSEKEIITEKLIKTIATENFPFVNKIIIAIKNSDYEILKRYEDIKDQKPWFNELFENTKVEISNREKAREIQNSEKRKGKIREQNVMNDLCIFLEEMGYEYSKVEDIVAKTVKKYGKDKEISFLKKEVAKNILDRPLSYKKSDLNQNNDDSIYADFLIENKKEI